jgi:hypothetical protein
MAYAALQKTVDFQWLTLILSIVALQQRAPTQAFTESL